MTGENMQAENTFTTSLPVQVLVRPAGESQTDWQDLDSGPGVITVPSGREIMVRAKGINDARLETLVEEIGKIEHLVGLNLAENRNVTDVGLVFLKNLPGLKILNLSSCSLTSTGLQALKHLPRLTRLDLSYCNRLTDAALKVLDGLQALEYLNLQGCVKITNGGVARIRLRGLEIHK